MQFQNLYFEKYFVACQKGFTIDVIAIRRKIAWTTPYKVKTWGSVQCIGPKEGGSARKEEEEEHERSSDNTATFEWGQSAETSGIVLENS